MAALNEIFPVILYGLLIILVIALIILIVRLIKTLVKVDKIVDDVNIKISKLNGAFDIIDGTTDALVTFGDKFSNIIFGSIDSVFAKKKGRDENE